MHSPNHNALDELAGGQSALILPLPNPEATLALGRELAPWLRSGMVVWLRGELGAGKTTLARALLRGVGHVGPVKSPTYTLVEVYVVSSIYWYHFDFYRLSEPEEFDDAGLDEYFRNDAVCLVEWPEKAAGRVPPADLECVFRFAGNAAESGRALEVAAYTEAGRKCLDAVKSFRPDAGN